MSVLDLQAWARRVELRRLRRMPRNVPGATRLLGPAFRFLDAASFRAQYLEIFQGEAYRFRPRSSRPRILDCGANVGVATAYFKAAFPDARVTAFEPDPAAADTFQANQASLGWPDVELVRAAVWSREGQLPFTRPAADAGRISDGSGGGRQESVVPAVRLRDRLDAPVDLLKLDIEGAELEVLEDLRGALAEVDHLFVELHSFVGRPQRLGTTLALLEEEGYRLHVRPAVVADRPFVETFDHLGMDLQLNVYASRGPNRTA